MIPFCVSVIAVELLILCSFNGIQTAPQSDAGNESETKVDGNYMMSLSKTINNPIFELFGRALLQAKDDIKYYVDNQTSQMLTKTQIETKIERKILRTMTDTFEEFCRQDFCGKWAEWSKCSGNTTVQFGVTSRSRTCGYNRFKICLGKEKRTTEEETKLCKVCDALPIVTNGHLERKGHASYIASLKCDRGYNAAKENIMCQTSGKWEDSICEKIATDCVDIQDLGRTQDGVYNITLWNSFKVLQVYCDMTTDGGGWTV